MQMQFPSSEGWITDAGGVQSDARPIVGWVVGNKGDESPFYPVILDQYSKPKVLLEDPINMSYDMYIWRKLAALPPHVKSELMEGDDDCTA